MCEAEFCCDEGAVLAALDYYDRHSYEPCATQRSNAELSEKERLKQRVCNQRKEIAVLHKQLADAYASIELASDACKTIEANYKSQLAEKEIELQTMRIAANQYKHDFISRTKTAEICMKRNNQQTGEIWKHPPENLAPCPLCGAPLTHRINHFGGDTLDAHTAYCNCGFIFCADVPEAEFIRRCNRRANAK